jgi:DNA-binding GntR family transcriptional regulator
MLATSHFPKVVTDKAPELADPNRGVLPELLREAFGETYSHDVITTRMPTLSEQQRLDLQPGTPVLVIKVAPTTRTTGRCTSSRSSLPEVGSSSLTSTAPCLYSTSRASERDQPAHR